MTISTVTDSEVARQLEALADAVKEYKNEAEKRLEEVRKLKESILVEARDLSELALSDARLRVEDARVLKGESEELFNLVSAETEEYDRTTKEMKDTAARLEHFDREIRALMADATEKILSISALATSINGIAADLGGAEQIDVIREDIRAARMMVDEIKAADVKARELLQRARDFADRAESQIIALARDMRSLESMYADIGGPPGIERFRREFAEAKGTFDAIREHDRRLRKDFDAVEKAVASLRVVESDNAKRLEAADLRAKQTEDALQTRVATLEAGMREITDNLEERDRRMKRMRRFVRVHTVILVLAALGLLALLGMVIARPDLISAFMSTGNRHVPLPVIDVNAPAANAPPHIRRAIARMTHDGEVHIPLAEGGFDVCMLYRGVWRYNEREQKAGHTIYFEDNRKYRTIDYLERLHRAGARKIYLVASYTGNQPYVEIDLRPIRTVRETRLASNNTGNQPRTAIVTRTFRMIRWPDYAIRETRPGKTSRLQFIGAVPRTGGYLRMEEHTRDLRVLRGVSQAKGNRLLDVNRSY